MKDVASHANSLVKRARRLRRGAGRRDGSFYVEGAQPAWRLVESGWDVEALLVCPELVTNRRTLDMALELDRRGVPVARLTPALFEHVAGREGPTGIAALARRPAPLGLASIRLGERALVLAVEHPSNPGNLGTIVRTADALGCAAVVSLGTGCDPLDPRAVRASMGSAFTVPHVRCEASELLAWARAQGAATIASSGYAEASMWDLRPPARAVLLLGNEGEGLSDDLLAAADAAVRIPMVGRAESLNLAAAAAVLGYALSRERLGSAPVPARPAP